MKSGRVATGLVMMAAMAACSRVPSKPASLPAGAQWVGTGKGAAFVQVAHLSGTLWQLEVWDRKGTPLASGTFRLRGFARARIYPDEILGWQQGALQLKDGTWLFPEPAAPAKAAGQP